MGSAEARHEISQRDLRQRSKEIMDAVEAGHSFTVTRDGRRIGELVPLGPARQFVSRERFAMASAGAPVIDAARFRADQHDAWDNEIPGPDGG